jgi:2-C-methyl-D-erythritol 4-phosphate cytidylyltransferase
MPEVEGVVIVCDPYYQPFFQQYHPHEKIQFAPSGMRRQDSLFNGLQAISNHSQLICVHDSARPFISESLVRRVLDAAQEHGAATVGMPIKFTVKESDSHHMVKKTPDRNFIWEIQTPQVIRPDLLKKGFEIANQKGLTVTDDTSLVELFGHPVKLVQGSYSNIKITTQEDLFLAERLATEYHAAAMQL